jgi:hypothetical protein
MSYATIVSDEPQKFNQTNSTIHFQWLTFPNGFYKFRFVFLDKKDDNIFTFEYVQEFHRHFNQEKPFKLRSHKLKMADVFATFKVTRFSNCRQIILTILKGHVRTFFVLCTCVIAVNTIFNDAL